MKELKNFKKLLSITKVKVNVKHLILIPLDKNSKIIRIMIHFHRQMRHLTLN